jgi:hypothetical protein
MVARATRFGCALWLPLLSSAQCCAQCWVLQQYIQLANCFKLLIIGALKAGDVRLALGSWQLYPGTGNGQIGNYHATMAIITIDF